MVGRVIALGLGLVLAAGCECDRDVCFRLPVEDPDGETFGRGIVFHVDHDGVPADSPGAMGWTMAIDQKLTPLLASS